MLLPKLLYPLVRLVLGLAFRRITVSGHRPLPTGPVLLVGNHPNLVFDPLLISAFTPGGIPRFLGKSTLFGKRPIAFTLRLLGVIPVARSQDGVPCTGPNAAMLDTACRLLHQGTRLALFPEGKCHQERRVLPLKSGAARIALRVEDESAGQAGVQLVPVGIVYGGRGFWDRTVHLRFGEPVKAGAFLEQYRCDRRCGAMALTQLLHERLENLSYGRPVPGPSRESAGRPIAAPQGPTDARQSKTPRPTARLVHQSPAATGL